MLQYDVFADEDFDPRRRLPVPATSIQISTGPGRSELTLLSVLILRFWPRSPLEKTPRMVVLKSEALEMQEAYEQLDELEQKESFFEKGTSMQLQRTEVCTLLD